MMKMTSNQTAAFRVLLIWPYNLHARKRPELFPIGLGYLLTSLQKNGLYGHIHWTAVFVIYRRIVMISSEN